MFYGSIPAGMTVDHRDGNPANNKIDNLRLATFVEQGHNVKLHCKSTSGVKGVSWHKPRGKWRAYIRVNGVTKHLGLFDTLDEAAKVATDARKELHGEFYRDSS